MQRKICLNIIHANNVKIVYNLLLLMNFTVNSKILIPNMYTIVTRATLLLAVKMHAS